MQAQPSISTYPLVLTNLAQCRCVVVGGGAVAERKAGELLAAGAQPEVISPTLTEALTHWQAEGRIEHQARLYCSGDLEGAFLVIAATSDAAVNTAIAAEGAARNILVNVADDPDAGNFHTVGCVRRGDLLLTVSTGGASPVLAARIRRALNAHYGPAYGQLLALLRALRDGPVRALAPAQRRQFWQTLELDAPLQALEQGDPQAAETLLYAHFLRLSADCADGSG